MLSPYEGHGLVLSALSEKRDDEQFRFQWLIESLAITRGFGLSGHDTTSMPESLWEWRSAVIGLLNALANTPDNLELRCELRGEMHRRGLVSALDVSLCLSSCSMIHSQALRHQDPPESFVSQIDLYQEESKEDWAELRWLNLSEAEGGLHAAAGALIRAAENSGGIKEIILGIMQRLEISLSRDVDE